jgi:hypothetical protein
MAINVTVIKSKQITYVYLTKNVCEQYFDFWSLISDAFSWLVGFMVFNTTFNNISVISWWSVLLVEETRGSGENHQPDVTDKFYHIMLYTSPWAGVEPTTSVVIGTDCICSCKSNYHTIMATLMHSEVTNNDHINHDDS